MFERQHHRFIQQVLEALDGLALREHCCYFGGGTAIALREGEYRESVDLDFLVSRLSAYRELRQLLGLRQGLAPLLRHDSAHLIHHRAVARGRQVLWPGRFATERTGSVRLYGEDANRAKHLGRERQGGE